MPISDYEALLKKGTVADARRACSLGAAIFNSTGAFAEQVLGRLRRIEEAARPSTPQSPYTISVWLRRECHQRVVYRHSRESGNPYRLARQNMVTSHWIGIMSVSGRLEVGLCALLGLHSPRQSVSAHVLQSSGVAQGVVRSACLLVTISKPNRKGFHPHPNLPPSRGKGLCLPLSLVSGDSFEIVS